METKDIEFQFKGARKYIQGPDIFNAMMTLSNHLNPSNIRFTAHDFISSPHCKLYLTEFKDELNEVAGIRARCQFAENGVMYWLAVVQESGDTSLALRTEYDEGKITSLCTLDQERIVLTKQSPFTFIESVVSMNKYMHQQLFPEAVGKWIFTRIDLDLNCNARDKLELHFRHNMNYRLTKSDILVNGIKVGDIYFSLVKS